MLGITIQLPPLFAILLASCVALSLISLVVLIIVLFKLSSIEQGQEILFDSLSDDGEGLPAMHLPDVRVERVYTAAEMPAAPVCAGTGVGGEVTLSDVPDRTAAMLMAIVADELGAPLETLRFISIREVK